MQRHVARVLSVVLCGLIAASFVPVAHAQFRASVEGTVTDASGDAVSGATVTVTNTETGTAQTTTSADGGSYRVSGLPPGVYTVSAESSGFKKAVVEEVKVDAEAAQRVDLALTVGDVAESVTVTDDTVSLQTENANVGGNISNIKIQQLPQIGRDPYELVRLAPGVFGDGARSGNGNSAGLPNTTGPGGSNSSIFQTENQVPISANGQRLSSNNFTIDGVSVNSQDWGGSAVVTPNQESVQEIQVLANAYSAEDGRNSGAQIKVVSKNGTNEFHGSGVFKYQSPGLNAYNKYGGPNNAPVTRVDDNFRNYAGSIGGPIVKDKLFFFFSYEGAKQNSTSYSNRYIETDQYRQLVQQLRPGSVTAQVFASPGIEPRAVAILPVGCEVFGNDPARCRVVNGGLDIGSLTGGTGQYVSGGNPTGGGFDGIPDIQFAQIATPGSSRGNQFNGRADYNLSDNDRIFGSFYVTKLNLEISNEAAASRPQADLAFKPLNTAATAAWIRTWSPTVVNELRWNFTRFTADQTKDSVDTNFGIPRIEVEALPFDRIRFGADRAETTPAVFDQNTFDLSDTVTWIRGSQTWKIGGTLRWEQDNNNLLGGARPLYSFTGLFNLANDAPVFEAINADPSTGAPADAQRSFRSKDISAFFQNDWKVTPRLTLNLGLRYEYFTPLSETENRISNLIFPAADLTSAQVQVVDSLYSGDKNNFGPRFGFAYNPNVLEDRFVVRGGFGLAYNRIPNAIFANSRGNPPFFARYNLCCGTDGSPFAGGQILYALGSSNDPSSYPVNPILGTGINPATGGPNGGAVEIYGSEPELANPYVYLYSLETETLLPGNLVGRVGYEGSAGHKLVRLVNENFLYTPNPAFYAVYFPQPDVNTNFNALLATLERRFAQGLAFTANYRFSKSIDTLSYEGPGFVTNQTYPQDLASERGPSDYDAKHFFNLSAVWELPFLRDRSDWVGKALGGWQINSIVTYHSGFPFTPKINRAVSTPSGQFVGPIRPTAYFGGAGTDQSADAFELAGGNFPGGGARYFDTVTTGPPGIGRNSFRGPRYKAVDFTFGKLTGLPSSLGLGESAKIDFRVNCFNCFNINNPAPFSFGDAGTFADSNDFGLSPSGLAGRVIEFQARFSF